MREEPDGHFAGMNGPLNSHRSDDPLTKKQVGWLFNLAFLCTIPLANWTLARFGFWDVPWLGPVASGVIWVGVAFVLRDLAQTRLGKWWTLPAIAVGVLLSYWLATPAIATASGVAFGLSELMDWAIFTPLAARGRFTLGVLISGMAGAFVDSAAFLYVAFGSFEGWWQLAVVKIAVLAVATPVARHFRQ